MNKIKLLLCPGTMNNLCFVLTFIITLKYFKYDTSTFIYTNKFNQYQQPAMELGQWQAAEIFGGLLATESQSDRVPESQIPKGTQYTGW